jgi:hypothetical protein
MVCHSEVGNRKKAKKENNKKMVVPRVVSHYAVINFILDRFLMIYPRLRKEHAAAFVCVYREDRLQASVLDGCKPGIFTPGKQSGQARRRYRLQAISRLGEFDISR